MAVLKAIEVKVRVNGEDATEYDDPEPQGNAPLAQKTVIKYIESVDDAEFEFVCRALPEYNFEDEGFVVWAYIDGKRIAGAYCDYVRRMNDVVIDGEKRSTGLGQGQLLRFKFSSLTVIESANSDKIKEDIKKSGKLGELSVHVRRYDVKYPAVTRDAATPSRVSNQGVEISEKALKGKALSHGTSTGKVSTLSNYRTQDCNYIDKEDDPFATFVFRYRSKNALVSEMVIPREASPEAAGVNRDPVDELSVEELRRIARQHLKGNHLSDVKPEPVIKPERGLKRERIRDPVATIDLEAPPKKHRKTSLARPIDLTSDSD